MLFKYPHQSVDIVITTILACQCCVVIGSICMRSLDGYWKRIAIRCPLSVPGPVVKVGTLVLR